MNKQQRRAPLQTSKSSKALSSRKGSSYPQAHSRSGSCSRRSAGPDVTYQKTDSNEEDVSGLPQFCMTCEKQIVTPGTSILYCSMACRRKDASRPLSMHAALPTPSSIPTAASYFDLPEHDIVPPRSPTNPRPVSLNFSDYYASEPEPTIKNSKQAMFDNDNNDNNDDDDDAGGGFFQFPPFQSHGHAERQKQEGRSRQVRTSSNTDGPPSLSHTPSSSVGTVGSVDPNILRRYHRSSGFFHCQSVDLVMPSFEELKVSQSEQHGPGASLASAASVRTAFRVTNTEDPT